MRCSPGSARCATCRRDSRRARPSTDARGPRIGRAAVCSLLAPTGEQRRVAVARARVEDVRAIAHRHGATVNDVVLIGDRGALHTCLERRGEQVDAIVVGVPVAIRRTATVQDLGNRLGEIRAAIPTIGDPAQRLERVVKIMRARKQAAIGLRRPVRLFALSPRSASTTGTCAANVSPYRRDQPARSRPVPDVLRRPRSPTSLPLAVGGGGNVTVTFAALSYAGTLAITVTADPDAMPDLLDTTAALQAELDALTGVESSRQRLDTCPVSRSVRPSGNRIVQPGASCSTRPRHSMTTGGTSRGSTLTSAPFPLTRTCIWRPR